MKNTFSNDALTGKKALLFASSQGLGRSAAEQLALMGADVVISGRKIQTLEPIAQQIADSTGANVDCEILDLVDSEAVIELINRHLDTDILVTNCGGPPVAPFEEIAMSDWDDAYQMIIRSVVASCQQLVPAMASRGWGRVIMMTSSVVVDPMRNFSLSNSLRKSLLGLAQSLAEEYAEHGVTANLVCPGLTETARMQSLIEGIVERTGDNKGVVLNRLLTPIAAKRMAAPEEIAAVVAFLASEQAGFIQGQAILVDGGQSVNP
jgi:3-oxoacyl-[acyl-carrier protein] reductase